MEYLQKGPHFWYGVLNECEKERRIEKKRKNGERIPDTSYKEKKQKIWKSGTAMESLQGVALLLNLAAPCHGSSLSRVYSGFDLRIKYSPCPRFR